MNIPVLITYSNYGYIDFAKNLILNLSKILKHHKLHFYCLDKQTYDELSKTPRHFLTVELFEQDVSSDFENYNTVKYNKLTHTKTNVLRDAFKKYEFIHFIDCDVVCLKEPSVNYYSRYSSYDIVFQYDWLFKNNIPLDKFGKWQCTGNMSLRRTSWTLNIIKQLEELQALADNKNDQDCLMDIFSLAKVKDIRNYRDAKLFVYPPEEYTNGSWKGPIDSIYFFHANHVVGKADKINLLKKVNQWFL
jgi:hypothetical protein